MQGRDPSHKQVKAIKHREKSNDPYNESAVKKTTVEGFCGDKLLISIGSLVILEA